MIKIWSRVPDKSKLQLSVDSESESLVASARVLDDEGTEVQWDDGDVRPGPATQKLKSPRKYSIRIRVAFMDASDTKATVRAEIIKPDGTTFGTPWELPVEGVNGDIARGDIVIATATT